jgi:hypothetical protein
MEVKTCEQACACVNSLSQQVNGVRQMIAVPHAPLSDANAAIAQCHTASQSPAEAGRAGLP